MQSGSFYGIKSSGHTRKVAHKIKFKTFSKIKRYIDEH